MSLAEQLIGELVEARRPRRQKSLKPKVDPIPGGDPNKGLVSAGNSLMDLLKKQGFKNVSMRKDLGDNIPEVYIDFKGAGGKFTIDLFAREAGDNWYMSTRVHVPSKFGGFKVMSAPGDPAGAAKRALSVMKSFAKKRNAPL